MTIQLQRAARRLQLEGAGDRKWDVMYRGAEAVLRGPDAERFAPRQELAVDLKADVVLLVPDVKMVEGDKLLLQIIDHSTCPHWPEKILAIGESEETTSVLFPPTSAFCAMSSARMNS